MNSAMSCPPARAISTASKPSCSASAHCPSTWAITAKAMRRAVLFHSVLSFAYNTAILALAMNLLAGLLG